MKVTVEDGVVIKFKDNTALIVNGELDVRGTSSTLTYFTSYHDDSVGGDTNNDSSTTNATSGDWKHIKIGSGASTTINGAVVRYGGGDASSSANVWNNGGMLNVSYADVSYSYHYGLRVDSGATTVTEAQVHNNVVGIGIPSGQTAVASSSIFNNSGYGAWQAGSPTSTMTDNYWGGWSPTSTANPGPLHDTNTNGVGNDVSNYIGYSPYASAYLYNPTLSSSSVRNNQIRWGGSTASSSEWYDGIDKWNNVSPRRVELIDASSTTSSTWNLYVEDMDIPDYQAYGDWASYVTSTQKSRIRLNYAFFGPLSSEHKKVVVMHEWGHALGLDHSYSGDNAMRPGYFFSPANLGLQDLNDYEFRWGNWWSRFKLWGGVLE